MLTVFSFFAFSAGMEVGHPGRPGASAAQAVRLGLKSASDPVTILRPGMAAECVWGKAENRGMKRVFISCTSKCKNQDLKHIIIIFRYSSVI